VIIAVAVRARLWSVVRHSVGVLVGSAVVGSLASFVLWYGPFREAPPFVDDASAIRLAEQLSRDDCRWAVADRDERTWGFDVEGAPSWTTVVLGGDDPTLGSVRLDVAPDSCVSSVKDDQVPMQVCRSLTTSGPSVDCPADGARNIPVVVGEEVWVVRSPPPRYGLTVLLAAVGGGLVGAWAAGTAQAFRGRPRLFFLALMPAALQGVLFWGMVVAGGAEKLLTPWWYGWTISPLTGLVIVSTPVSLLSALAFVAMLVLAAVRRSTDDSSLHDDHGAARSR
jgi:hypothetical protein